MPRYRSPDLATRMYGAFDARVAAQLRDGVDPAPPTVEPAEHAAQQGREHRMFMVRQGDVLVYATKASVPSTAQPVPSDTGRVILAYGEVTGHAHALSAAQAELYADLREADHWLVVHDIAGADLRHDEHATIHLPPGTYRVRRQREYRPESNIRVVD